MIHGKETNCALHFFVTLYSKRTTAVLQLGRMERLIETSGSGKFRWRFGVWIVQNGHNGDQAQKSNPHWAFNSYRSHPKTRKSQAGSFLSTIPTLNPMTVSSWQNQIIFLHPSTSKVKIKASKNMHYSYNRSLSQWRSPFQPMLPVFNPLGLFLSPVNYVGCWINVFFSKASSSFTRIFFGLWSSLWLWTLDGTSVSPGLQPSMNASLFNECIVRTNSSKALS